MRTLNDVMQSLPKQRADAIYERVNQTIASLELAKLRKEQGFTQQIIAEKLGVSQSAISQIETTDNIQLSTLAKYVEALGGQLNLSINLPNGRQLSVY